MLQTIASRFFALLARISASGRLLGVPLRGRVGVFAVYLSERRTTDPVKLPRDTAKSHPEMAPSLVRAKRPQGASAVPVGGGRRRSPAAAAGNNSSARHTITALQSSPDA